MKYLLDTNIFIRSKNEMPSDVWPTFWRLLAALIADGAICSCAQVKEEIERGDDELTQWMSANAPEGFYLPMSGDVIEKYSAVQNWAAASGRFLPAALQGFAMAADAYLVATAAAKQMTVVTYETSDPACRRRVKIPDACLAMGVRCCDLNTAFRELGVSV